MKELEFEFLNKEGNIEFDLRKATHLSASFKCSKCEKDLEFKKPYEPVPLHYESIIAICKDVTCECGSTYKHLKDGDDFYILI